MKSCHFFQVNLSIRYSSTEYTESEDLPAQFTIASNTVEFLEVLHQVGLDSEAFVNEQVNNFIKSKCKNELIESAVRETIEYEVRLHSVIYSGIGYLADKN